MTTVIKEIILLLREVFVSNGMTSLLVLVMLIFGIVMIFCLMFAIWKMMKYIQQKDEDFKEMHKDIQKLTTLIQCIYYKEKGDFCE